METLIVAKQLYFRMRSSLPNLSGLTTMKTLPKNRSLPTRKEGSSILMAFTDNVDISRKSTSLLLMTVQLTGTGSIISSFQDMPMYFFCMLKLVLKQMITMDFNIFRWFNNVQAQNTSVLL